MHLSTMAVVAMMMSGCLRRARQSFSLRKSWTVNTFRTNLNSTHQQKWLILVHYVYNSRQDYQRGKQFWRQKTKWLNKLPLRLVSYTINSVKLFFGYQISNCWNNDSDDTNWQNNVSCTVPFIFGAWNSL